MEDKRQTFWEKAAKEASGNASEEDKAWLRQQDPEAETVAKQAQKVWQGTALPDAAYEPDVEKGWQRFRLKVEARTAAEIPEINLPEKTVVRKMYPGTMYGIAASIALFILVGVYFLTRTTNQNWTEVRTAANETKTILL